MTAVAYFRVYLPVEMLDSEGVDLPEAGLESGGSLRPATDVGLIRGSLRDEMLIAEWQGGRFGCPRRPLLRAMEGLLAFRTAYSGIGGEYLVPEDVVRRAAAHLDVIYEQPLARSFILTSAWHVPLRWFTAFDPSEREILEVDGRTSIRYRTSQAEAVRRLQHVTGVLRGVGMDDAVVSELDDLLEWIDAHPAEAMVELDYGSVAGLFDEAELVLDESSSELWESIDALASDDWEKAGTHYMAVASRWAGPMAVAFSS